MGITICQQQASVVTIQPLNFTTCLEDKCTGLESTLYSQCKLKCLVLCGSLISLNVTSEDLVVREAYCKKSKQIAAVALGFKVTFSTSQDARHENYRLNAGFRHLPYGATAWETVQYQAGAWCPMLQDTNQWIQVTSEIPRKWVAVETQGRNGQNYWVKAYTLEYTLDGITWVKVNNGNLFMANKDQNTPVKQVFLTPIYARAIRLYIKDATPDFACMRFEVYYIE
eukprot:TRINITY_DN2494_c0_g1_i4.p1 TRINITY_DN2494_c0_g1~~TRINITY_DN2494_c0_g1_i4.p1  ORF type:complete len:226 (+),score=27.19 TRINITY_DN2494_c0_g1_i4:116-793(+)